MDLERQEQNLEKGEGEEKKEIESPGVELNLYRYYSKKKRNALVEKNKDGSKEIKIRKIKIK